MHARSRLTSLQLSLEAFGHEGGAAAIARVRDAMEMEAEDSPDLLPPGE